MPRSKSCVSLFPWMSTRMGARQGSHRKCRRTTSSQTPCAPDRSRSPAWRTCPTGRSWAGIRRAFLAATRTPEPGELYRHHLERLAWMDEMVAKHGLRRALIAADIERAHGAGQPAIVIDIEGLDFREMKLERLEEAHHRGVRHAQLVHYTPNDIGDFQTGAVTHNGLTPFGAEAIQACHRLGVVCDVAHASEDTVKQASKV